MEEYENSDLDFSFTSTTTDRTFATSSSSARSSLALSFNGRLSTTATSSSSSRPHRSNDPHWSAITAATALSPLHLSHLKLLRLVGAGDLGRVFHCRLRDNDHSPSFALKVVDRDSLSTKKLCHVATEAEILSVLDHPFLPTLYARLEASHYTCLLMDYCPNGDLHSVLRKQPNNRLSVSAVRFYASEILIALEYLHSLGIVYRDLKPENVLIREDGHVMLSDFDLCFQSETEPKLVSREEKVVRKTKRTFGNGKTKEKIENLVEFVAEPTGAFSKSCVGTHEYLAPELISVNGHGNGVDWWAFGVLLYELLFGVTPFKGDSKEATLRNIASSRDVRFKERDQEGGMAEAMDLIEKLLVKDPRTRLGCDKGATEIKNHPFFNGIKWPLIRTYKPPEVRGVVVKKAKTNVAIRRRWSWKGISCLFKKSNGSKCHLNCNSNYYSYSSGRKTGFSAPTPIQAQSWPIALQGRDIVAVAKTGSGKTLGYLIPGFVHLKRSPKNPQMGPTILVLSPTRELATQIQDEAVKFGKSSRISCTCLYGGAPKGPQLRDLDRGVDVVVATPGRLNDILEMKRVSLNQVSYLVLDEADRMLDMGFEPQIRKIVNAVPTRRQTLMYTATWPKEVRKIAADLLVNPVQVNIGNIDELVANKSITQHVELLPPMEKHRRLEQILRSQEPGSKVIIFCSTKRMCDQLARNLSRQCGAAAIHGDKSQGERDHVLAEFRSGKCPILVATDVAARGLDVKDIRVVVNYDFPTGVEDYVHRIGRTGRAGATGVAYTFFGDQDGKYARDLIKVLEGASQRVPAELREMASRGGFGRATSRWGSSGSFGGGRGGGGGRNDSGYGGGRSSYGGRGSDRDSGYGNNGGSNNRVSRARSRSPERFDPVPAGRSFHEMMMEKSRSSATSFRGGD